MRASLLALAVGAAAAGVLGLSATAGLLPKFLTPVLGPTKEAVAGPSQLVRWIISVAVALPGIPPARFRYPARRLGREAGPSRLAGAATARPAGFFVDDCY